MNIPDKAMEAAFRAVVGDQEMHLDDRMYWEQIARDMLTAAAPYIAAQTWDQGYDVGRNDGWHDARDNTPNPYRA